MTFEECHSVGRYWGGDRRSRPAARPEEEVAAIERAAPRRGVVVSEYRVRCGVCRRMRPEEETVITRGRGGGNYSRPSRLCDRRVCRDCVVERVEYVRSVVYEGRGEYVSEHRIDWAYAARRFGIDFADLPSSATADAIERARAYREEHNLGTYGGTQ